LKEARTQTYQIDKENYSSNITEIFKVNRALCRGENVSNEHDKSLYCSFVTNNHSFLILGPIKQEIISIDPIVVVYYDIISQERIKTIKNMANKRVFNISYIDLLTLYFKGSF